MNRSESAEPPSDSLDRRFLTALSRSRQFTGEKLRALLEVLDLVSSAEGFLLAKWREGTDRAGDEHSKLRELELRNPELQDALDFSIGRLRRLLALIRKPYSPEERFRIVLHVRAWNLTFDVAADRFQIDTTAISR